MVSYQVPADQAQKDFPPPSDTPSAGPAQQADSVEQVDVPAILRPGFGALPQKSSDNATNTDDMPAALKPGGKGAQSNPFRAAKEQTQQPEPPTESFSNMSVNQTSNNPWGAALLTSDHSKKQTPQLLPELGDTDPWTTPDPIIPKKETTLPVFEDNAWGSGSQSRQTATPEPPKLHPLNAAAALNNEENVWEDLSADLKRNKAKQEKQDESDDDWNMIDSETSSLADGEAGKTVPDTPAFQPTKPMPPAQSSQLSEQQRDEPKTEPLVPVPVPTVPRKTVERQTGLPAEDTEYSPPPFPPPKPSQESTLVASSSAAQNPTTKPAEEPVQKSTEQSIAATVDSPEGERPPLPPRDSNLPKWTPPRQPVDPKAETYQVKNIRWHDPRSQKNPRTSPILIQNENGPCPLVALVNALSLTTPTDKPDTGLVNALRSRERVSLNLVLDVVFDELMSRTPSEDALPDVTELYAFLQSLHTGMNVNPRFIPTPELVNAYKRSSLTHLHPTERDNLMPGTFENSMEMKLYATFSIPLIHGWLPEKGSPAYQAFERQAATYEDAQNLLFREEELEDKLSSPGHGLSGSEQQLYQDIMTIKMFMDESATQLTSWGIEVIGKAIRPGTFAILFRNDHFSTLYCHPNTMQLLTLVTDAGYKSHDEVVWESLVDVTGERTEIYSGDFRVVGSTAGPGASSSSGNNQGRATYTADQGGEWTTVQNRRGKNRQEEPDTPLDAAEQEDRDLALALQLQEEEEQRERDERERRRRESLLSEQYIEQQGRPPAPVRRDGRRTSGAGAGAGAGVGAGRGSSATSVSSGDIAPARRSSNSLNTTVSGGSGNNRRPQVPAQQQQVRPLVPPRRPATHRPAEGGEDLRPPSYEQSAHDRTYVPPAGGNAGGPTAATSPAMAQGQMNAGRGGYYGQQPRPGRMSHPMGQAAGHGRDRDRDCVVM